MAEKKKRLSERTTTMMNNFMEDKKAGLSNREIAEKYGLSDQTVYNRLQEIADKYGLNREDLLDEGHIWDNVSESIWIKRHEETKKHLADIKEYISKTKTHTQGLLDVVNNFILEEENTI